MDVQPEQVAEFAQPDCLDAGYFHGIRSRLVVAVHAPWLHDAQCADVLPMARLGIVRNQTLPRFLRPCNRLPLRAGVSAPPHPLHETHA
jgi:hypothetical protein